MATISKTAQEKIVRSAFSEKLFKLLEDAGLTPERVEDLQQIAVSAGEIAGVERYFVIKPILKKDDFDIEDSIFEYTECVRREEAKAKAKAEKEKESQRKKEEAAKRKAEKEKEKENQ